MKKKSIPVEELDFTDVFFKEVSEDVQNDNLKAFWKKYGVQIVAGVALCLTIAVSFETIKHWRDLQNQKWSDAFAYTQLLKNQTKESDSLKALTALEKDGNAIYSDIARFEKVNILLDQGRSDEAFEQLDSLVKNAHNDKLKHVALLKLASYKADVLSPTEMAELVQPLFNTVWAPDAKEFIALTFLRNNEKEQALKIYQEIVSLPSINDILRARAQNMISVLTSSGDNN